MIIKLLEKLVMGFMCVLVIIVAGGLVAHAILLNGRLPKTKP